MTYSAPILDIRFTLDHAIGLDPLIRSGAYPGLDDELVDSVLNEAGKLAANVIAPLNAKGDSIGAVLENGAVRSAPGFAGAYRAFVEGGWNGLAFDPDHGGQGMPWRLAIAVQEMWHAANMA